MAKPSERKTRVKTVAEGHRCFSLHVQIVNWPKWNWNLARLASSWSNLSDFSQLIMVLISYLATKCLHLSESTFWLMLHIIKRNRLNVPFMMCLFNGVHAFFFSLFAVHGWSIRDNCRHFFRLYWAKQTHEHISNQMVKQEKKKLLFEWKLFQHFLLLPFFPLYPA